MVDHPRLELATVYEVVVDLLLEVATYGSKRFLGGGVNVLGEFLRGNKGSSNRRSGIT